MKYDSIFSSAMRSVRAQEHLYNEIALKNTEK